MKKSIPGSACWNCWKPVSWRCRSMNRSLLDKDWFYLVAKFKWSMLARTPSRGIGAVLCWRSGSTEKDGMMEKANDSAMFVSLCFRVPCVCLWNFFKICWHYHISLLFAPCASCAVVLNMISKWRWTMLRSYPSILDLGFCLGWHQHAGTITIERFLSVRQGWLAMNRISLGK